MKKVLNRVPILAGDTEVGLDIETALDDKRIKWKNATPFDQHLCIISLWIPSTDTAYVLEWGRLKNSPTAIAAIQKILGDRTVTKWIHNAVFDLHFLLNEGFEVNNVKCSQTLAQIYFCGDFSRTYRRKVGKSPFGLAELSRSIYGVELDKSSQQKDWDTFDPETDLDYVALDAKMTVLVGQSLWAALEPTCKFLEYEVGFIDALARMNANGFNYDRDRLAEFEKKVLTQQAEVQGFLNTLGEVNFRSPKQVIRFFGARFGFTVPFQNIKGVAKQSTAKPYLQSWALRDDLYVDIIAGEGSIEAIELVYSGGFLQNEVDKFSSLLPEFRVTGNSRFDTLLSEVFLSLRLIFDEMLRRLIAEAMKVFIASLNELRFLNYLTTVIAHFKKPQFQKNGRIRTISQPLAFDSDGEEGNGMGRTSTMSRCLPIQIIPKRSKYLSSLGSLRACFVPEEGKKYVAIDVAGSHAVIARVLTKDATLVKAFNEGLKIHYYTTSSLAALEGIQLTPLEVRDLLEDKEHPLFNQIKYLYGLAKEVIYSKLNAAGIGSIKLSLWKSGIKISDDMLSNIDKMFNATYAGLRKYGLDTMNRARYRWAELPPLPNQPSVGKLAKNEVSLTGQTIWVNPHYKANRLLSAQWLVSEAAALKMAIYKCDRIIQEEGLAVRILGLIHDEIIFECDEGIALEVAERFQNVMYSCMNAVIPGFGYPLVKIGELVKDHW